MSESNIVLHLKQGDTKALKEVYTMYRTEFLAFSKKFSVNNEDALDCYQDAIIAIQEQAIKGKLDDLKSSLKTYLFGIGKYMMYEKARKNNRTILHVAPQEEVAVVEVSYHEEANEQQLKLKEGLQKLGKKCREVLHLFYYRGFTIDEITDHLNYENKNVVKSQKSRCLKQLKSIINDF
ncbi:hypothetical protein WH52_04545 [Tenacibaculum holothuriorum]|uniref:RNA polymerase sigma-70 ECF-like HTH domain-containing protein n=1 Tax=Tenacibaculum holothuriorum TaxID=1635173 RepID=A0A1Y2PGX9_9FLAO|nr:sigma-70 family RNA polymerase sigma factor [Tenacibaculum holothuriorum]OSY88938.1 hypothetical protein WH52_04545 [Tenacibaculum holothuriorum]